MKQLYYMVPVVLFLGLSLSFSTQILHTPIDSGNTWNYIETKVYGSDTVWINHRMVSITVIEYRNADTIRFSAHVVDSNYRYNKFDSVKDCQEKRFYT